MKDVDISNSNYQAFLEFQEYLQFKKMQEQRNPQTDMMHHFKNMMSGKDRNNRHNNFRTNPKPAYSNTSRYFPAYQEYPQVEEIDEGFFNDALEVANSFFKD